MSFVELARLRVVQAYYWLRVVVRLDKRDEDAWYEPTHPRFFQNYATPRGIEDLAMDDQGAVRWFQSILAWKRKVDRLPERKKLALYRKQLKLQVDGTRAKQQVDSTRAR